MEKKEFVPPYPIAARLGLESVIGITAGLFVSPLITCIDKAITQNASGTNTLWRSLGSNLKSLAAQPHVFMRRPEQLWMWNIYACTYATANSVDAFCKNYGYAHEMPKLWITFFVNMATSILKDRAFVRLFGSIKPAPIPFSSYSFWAMRDILTISAAFIIPYRLSTFFAKNYGYDRKKAETVVTFWSPILLQFITTPIHLLGLDCYNNRNNTAAMRANFLKREYLKSLLARMGRMVPAYSIGGVLNLKLREFFFGDLNAKKVNK
jgi:hypothetical protein